MYTSSTIVAQSNCWMAKERVSQQKEGPLELLTEDWTFAHLTRFQTLWGPHGYHRYPAKFIPQLVQQIITSYSTPGDLVGDPFLGSATTGVEALRLGRRFLGSDISQVALLISRAKCTPLDPSTLAVLWQDIDNQLERLPRVGRRPLTAQEKQTICSLERTLTTRERLAYWFPDAYRNVLEDLLLCLLALTDDAFRTFFLCGFSNILKRCSIWLSGSTKAQKDLDKMPGDPIKEFRRQMHDMIRRNRLYWDDLTTRGIFPTNLPLHCHLFRKDARRLTIADATFDLLVTSPPYATCYEYKEIHQLTQLWLEHYGVLQPEHSPAAWIGTRGVAHRTSDTATYDPSLPGTGSAIADTALVELARLAVGVAAGRVRREYRALCYYFQDMFLALQELARVTIPGKFLILVIGDFYRRGITLPTTAALSEMATGLGLVLERKIVRQVPGRVLVSTRDKQSGRFSSTIHSDMQVYPEEYILVFRRLP